MKPSPGTQMLPRIKSLLNQRLHCCFVVQGHILFGNQGPWIWKKTVEVQNPLFSRSVIGFILCTGNLSFAFWNKWQNIFDFQIFWDASVYLCILCIFVLCCGYTVKIDQGNSFRANAWRSDSFMGKLNLYIWKFLLDWWFVNYQWCFCVQLSLRKPAGFWLRFGPRFSGSV